MMNVDDVDVEFAFGADAPRGLAPLRAVSGAVSSCAQIMRFHRVAGASPGGWGHRFRERVAGDNVGMKIEVLHISECPNWEHAGDRVRLALVRLEGTMTRMESQLLRTPGEAAAVPFAGSPTITLDDEDRFPPRSALRTLPAGSIARRTACRGCRQSTSWRRQSGAHER
ncbi:hypothetical protein GCM10009776_33600 [Microbacterium deminutum]|uniref:Uncharacterized protein n=1 Tax=Microbacterium deminutum TaxID=344164 RepID=A0ABP5CRP1_9MICO